MNQVDSELTGVTAGAFPAPEPKLLNPHLFAGHDLIPLNKPSARRANRAIGKAPRDRNWRNRDYGFQNPRDWMAIGLNVGIRLRADQLVIDVDPRNFNGTDRLEELCENFGINLDDYPRVFTGGGGFHIYMTKPAGLKTGEKLHGYPGIEFKTFGRQLVAAGSVHPGTRRYYRAEDPFGDLKSPPNAPETLLNALSKPKGKTAPSASELSTSELRELLGVLAPINYKDRDAWLRLMMACHQGTAGSGVEEFIAWSILDEQYATHTDSIRATWESLSSEREDGVTVRSLFKAVIDAGHSELVAKLTRNSVRQDFENVPAVVAMDDLDLDRFGIPKATFANSLRVLTQADFGFAYDELSRRPLLRAESLPWPVDVGRELNDDTLRMIRHHLVAREGIEFSRENVAEACLTLARQSPFNPVVDYLASLNWDGTPRLSEWLVRYLGVRDSEFARAISRLTLIGAVRRARSPGCKFDQVLILEGAQGSGKSSALKVLGGDWHSDAELGALDGKEAPLVLQGVWIHELGELTAMNRSEVEDLKAFVSRCEDRFRSPYDRMAQTHPRRCVFLGTTNAEAYLFDMTGNRRFWPVKTTNIDLDGLKSDRDQLWAEAAAAEAAGESVELARHLWPIAADEQAARLADDPWRDMLVAWLDSNIGGNPNDPNQTADAKRDRVHTRELLTSALNIEPARQTQHIAKRVRELMRTIGGWEYKRSLRIDGKDSAAGYQKTER